MDGAVLAGVLESHYREDGSEECDEKEGEEDNEGRAHLGGGNYIQS